MAIFSARIGAYILNKMTALGRPKFELGARPKAWVRESSAHGSSHATRSYLGVFCGVISTFSAWQDWAMNCNAGRLGIKKYAPPRTVTN